MNRPPGGLLRLEPGGGGGPLGVGDEQSDRHILPGPSTDRSGRHRGEREWGEWAGWTGWGGWPGAAGQHGWTDPDAYRDLERLAKQPDSQ